MSNVTGFFSFYARRMAGHLATWSNTTDSEIHTLLVWNKKLFMKTNLSVAPRPCASGLCRAGVTARMAIWSCLQGGHRHLSDCEDLHTILTCFKTCTPFIAFLGPLHIHPTDPCITHTHTNTLHNLSPQPPSLSIVISACGPHTPHDAGM